MTALRRIHSGPPPNGFGKGSAIIALGAVGLSIGAAWAISRAQKRPTPEFVATNTSSGAPSSKSSPRKRRSGKRHKSRAGLQPQPPEQDSDGSDPGYGPEGTGPRSSLPGAPGGAKDAAGAAASARGGSGLQSREEERHRAGERASAASSDGMMDISAKEAALREETDAEDEDEQQQQQQAQA